MVCVVGKRYPTRMGRLRLLDREDVSERLVEIPPEIAKPLIEMDMRVQPGMFACMQTWIEEMEKICRTKADARNLTTTFGLIYLTSAFRPIGTTAGSGAYRDCCGALDTHDHFGHWSGWAIDCPTRYTRESFFPVLSIGECRLAAKRAGLVRPFGGEWWHFRPKKTILLGE